MSQQQDDFESYTSGLVGNLCALILSSAIAFSVAVSACRSQDRIVFNCVKCDRLVTQVHCGKCEDPMATVDPTRGEDYGPDH